jgi:hypothetical protein
LPNPTTTEMSTTVPIRTASMSESSSDKGDGREAVTRTQLAPIGVVATLGPLSPLAARPAQAAAPPFVVNTPRKARPGFLLDSFPKGHS